LKKLLRVTAYANRFIKHTSTKQQTPKELTAEELNTAKVMWIRYLQRKHYITQNGQLNINQKQSQLNPSIFPDGIIRLNGRLINLDFPEEKKSPILLPQTFLKVVDYKDS